MHIKQREIIHSNLHQMDVLLKTVKSKVVNLQQQIGMINALIRQIEERKKPIYDLLETQPTEKT